MSSDDSIVPKVVDDQWVQFVNTGDPRLREELVERYLDLPRRLAHRFGNRGETYDDLVQVGSIALIKAVDRFDPTRGVEFTTYATTTVIGELKRHFRDKGWAVRAPRRVQELYLELGQVIESLSHQLGRSPTVPELAQATGSSEEAIIEAIEAGQGYRSASIDAPSQNNESLADRLASSDAHVQTLDDRSVLEPAMASLPERNQQIVRLRFVEGLTQSEIADRIGISQMHVSRLLTSSLFQLRRAFAEDP